MDVGEGGGCVAPSGRLQIKANTIFINESGLYSLILSSKLSSQIESKSQIYRISTTNILNDDEAKL